MVRHEDGHTRVLIIRDPYRNWGLPKGHVEPDETEAEAALREVGEETGLTDVVLKDSLGVIDWYFRMGSVLIHKYCRFFLMESRSGEPVPDASEGITECRWMTFDEALEQVAYDNARAVIQEARSRMESESNIDDD